MSVVSEASLAAIAGGLAGAVLGDGLARALSLTGPRALEGLLWMARAADDVLAPLRRAETEGALPTDRERLRLSVAAGTAGLLAGWLAAGRLAALAVGVLGAWLASRALVRRRVRYAQELDDEAPSAAMTLADGLSAGHSIESAVSLAARAHAGPVASELRRLSRDVELGVPVESALSSLRRRTGSRGMDLIAATISVQRRFGGNLAGLLRDVSDTLEEQARDEREARVATSQARFTARLVIGIPLLGMLVAELAAPGMLGRILGSPSGRLLVAAAVCLQAMGMVAIRRMGRVAP